MYPEWTVSTSQFYSGKAACSEQQVIIGFSLPWWKGAVKVSTVGSCLGKTGFLSTLDTNVIYFSELTKVHYTGVNLPCVCALKAVCHGKWRKQRGQSHKQDSPFHVYFCALTTKGCSPCLPVSHTHIEIIYSKSFIRNAPGYRVKKNQDRNHLILLLQSKNLNCWVSWIPNHSQFCSLSLGQIYAKKGTAADFHICLELAIINTIHHESSKQRLLLN